ncbi:MAG: MBL fold metallo-hydrolase [Halodesulfurarchaeum sp.]
MRVTLLGTGDTTGTPVPGCSCATCQRARGTGVERSRFSVHVQNDETGESLLVDASPDFRSQFLDHEVPLPDAAVITHIHFDHLDGLGNVYRLLDHLDVHAADELDPETGESVADTIRRKYAYLDRIDVIDHAPFESFRVAGFDVTLVPVDHPPLLSFGVLIEDDDSRLSITGDTSFAIPERSRERLAGPDLLLADGIVPASFCVHHPLGGRHEDENGVPRTYGTKHMTREGALDVARSLDAKRTRVVHASHRYPVDEAFDEEIAVDGETVDL